MRNRGIFGSGSSIIVLATLVFLLQIASSILFLVAMIFGIKFLLQL